LNVRSYYSFLDSTLSIQAIINRAAHRCIPAIALTDKGNLHGAVEFAASAKAAGIKPIIGAEINQARSPLLLFVQNTAGYRNLCRILTRPASLSEQDTTGLIAVGSDGTLEQHFPQRFYNSADVAVPGIHYAETGDRWNTMSSRAFAL